MKTISSSWIVQKVIDKEQIAQIKNKQHNDRFKPNHVNNYTKCKWSKHPN